jgi:anti-anti-sigma factor
MSLKVTSEENRPGVMVISPIGSIDTDTNPILDSEVDAALAKSPNVIIFDMEFVDYINSSGIRVLLKAKKAMKDSDGKVVFMHLQPQIQKVFDIIKALPSMHVFTSIEELDDYLDKMQKAVR